VTIAAYVVCSLCAGFSGIVFALDLNTVQPAGMGEFYELYAIAAAVLGGFSLRGGEGAVIGVIIGTAVLRVLQNAITILGFPSELEFAIIGAVLLGGVIVDELVKRFMAKKRARVAI
jgi:ribose transport system permease protein